MMLGVGERVFIMAKVGGCWCACWLGRRLLLMCFSLAKRTIKVAYSLSMVVLNGGESSREFRQNHQYPA